MARSSIDLAQGVWQYQTPLWQTNCLLAVADGDVILCDPSYTHDEIADLRAETMRRARRSVYLLITHGDFDHTCGIGYFPEATIVAGRDTAELIAAGTAAEKLRSAGAEWGADWPAALRVDRAVAAATEFACGAFRVAALDARGH